MRTPWRRFWAYAHVVPDLVASERLQWHHLIHSEPKAMRRALEGNLKPAAHPRQTPEQTLDTWLLDPFIARGIEIVEKLPPPPGSPSQPA